MSTVHCCALALLSHRWRAGKINSKKKHSLGESNTSVSCSIKHQFNFKKQTEIVRIFMSSDSELIPWDIFQQNEKHAIVLLMYAVKSRTMHCWTSVLTNQGIWITRWAKGPRKYLAIYTILLWNQFLHENTSIPRAASSTWPPFFCEK